MTKSTGHVRHKFTPPAIGPRGEPVVMPRDPMAAARLFLRDTYTQNGERTLRKYQQLFYKRTPNPFSPDCYWWRVMPIADLTDQIWNYMARVLVVEERGNAAPRLTPYRPNGRNIAEIRRALLATVDILPEQARFEINRFKYAGATGHWCKLSPEPARAP